MIQPAFNKYNVIFCLIAFFGGGGGISKDRYSELCGTVFQRWNLVTIFETFSFFIVHFDLIRGECLEEMEQN